MVIYTKEFLAQEIRLHGWNVGDYTYGKPTVRRWGNDGGLTIGRYCSIAGGVEIFLGGNHRIDWITTYPFNAIYKQFRNIKGHPATKGNVVIGNDVWIGEKSVILSGTHVADGSCIAAHSVVTRDVPPYSIVGGNPAKIIRQRFDDITIERLLSICWWDWPEDKVLRNVEILQSSHFELLRSD